MESPDHCDSIKKISLQVESESSKIVPIKEQNHTEMESPQHNVIEEMCKSYFESLKTDLFLSSLYLVLFSNVVLSSVLLAFAKVRIISNIHKA